MQPDRVPNRAQIAPLVGENTPVVIGVVKQAILGVTAVDGVNLANVGHTVLTENNPGRIHQIHNPIGSKRSINMRWIRAFDPIENPAARRRLNELNRIATELVLDFNLSFVQMPCVVDDSRRSEGQLGDCSRAQGKQECLAPVLVDPQGPTPN